MLTGIEVLFIAIATLVVVWVVVLYGSQYFGSTE
jgi:hypothetical protein